MIEMLQQIPGPEFLKYFLGLSIICIILGWLWANADGTDLYPLPELTRFGPVSIAALFGGQKLVIETVVFSLWNRHLAKTNIRKNWRKQDLIKIKNVPSRKRVLSPIEEDIYQFLESPREPRDLFQDYDLQNRIEQHLNPIYGEMEDLHLVRTEDDRSRVLKIKILMAIVISVVGGAKLYLGITYDRPVLLLAGLLIASLYVLHIVLKPTAIPTRLGRSYLKALDKNFRWLKDSINRIITPKGIDPALTIAIFGVGILGGASFYGPFSEAFSARKTDGGFWGGCGGGCGG